MRTTVTIDDELLEQARHRAQSTGRTLGQVLEAALRRDLALAEPRPRPAVPVFAGGDGPAPGVELDSNRALAELLDEGHGLDELR